MAVRMDAPSTAILDDLHALEQQHDVYVVAARDLGSHAKQTHDPDSDYDIMALYTQSPADYAGVGTYDDTIHDKGGDIEIFAWNIKKFSELLTQTNPTAIEFLQSPMRYHDPAPIAPTLDELHRHAKDRFTPVALIHHYRSLAYDNYRGYLQRRISDDNGTSHPVVNESDEYWIADTGDDDCQYFDKDGRFRLTGRQPIVKKNLIVMRALLLARYIEATHTLPPMDFEAFLDEHVTATGICDEYVDIAWDLLARKQNGDGQTDCGNHVMPFAEQEFAREIDEHDHLGDGIDIDIVNRFVQTALANDWESSVGYTND